MKDILNKNKSKQEKVELLRKIALKVRRVCYNFAQKAEPGRYDFSGDENLACMCGAASQILYNAIKKHEIEPKAVMGTSESLGDHVWVEVDNYIIDVTYTQYNGKNGDMHPTVILVDKDSEEARELYYNEFTHRLIRNDITEVLKGWPKGQVFNKSTIERLLMEIDS
jgi:hypothetical protein